MNITTQQQGNAHETIQTGDGTLSRKEQERLFQTWVDSVRWQFAKTYAKKAPHEYTITEWKPELDATFKQFVLFIRQNGQIDLYHGHPFTVLYMNGWKYWTMGSPVEETTLINRTSEVWSTSFKLTWNPPASFNPMPPAQCESCLRILRAYDAICQTPPAKISPVIKEKE